MAAAALFIAADDAYAEFEDSALAIEAGGLATPRITELQSQGQAAADRTTALLTAGYSAAGVTGLFAVASLVLAFFTRFHEVEPHGEVRVHDMEVDP